MNLYIPTCSTENSLSTVVTAGEALVMHGECILTKSAKSIVLGHRLQLKMIYAISHNPYVQI